MGARAEDITHLRFTCNEQGVKRGYRRRRAQRRDEVREAGTLLSHLFLIEKRLQPELVLRDVHVAHPRLSIGEQQRPI